MTARPKARGGTNSLRIEHSRAPWHAQETDTRTAIKDATGRTAAYVQLGPNQSYDAALIATAPQLLKLAVQYASECGECAGVGVTLENKPCEDCREIREIIAQATYADDGAGA